MGAGSPGKLSWPRQRLPEEHTALITGGNSGLGFETAKQLAFLGARVIIACRNENRAKAALLRIQADFIEFKDSLPEDSEFEAPDELRVEYMLVDLASLESVVRLVEVFKAKQYQLHTLVCNAGVAGLQQSYTEDRHEMHFQVNFLSHFLLCMHLLPIMKTSGEDSRLLLIASADHTGGNFNLKNIQSKFNYNRNTAYANSKLYLVMLMYCFHRRMEDTNVGVYAVNPGSTATELSKSAGKTSYSVGKKFGTMKKLVQGAATALNVAVNPYLKSLSGQYFSVGVPSVSSPSSRDVKAQEVLWKYAVGCVKDHVTRDLFEDLQFDAESVIDGK